MEKTNRYFKIMRGNEDSDPNEATCFEENIGKIKNENQIDEATEWDDTVTLKYNLKEGNEFTKGYILTDYLNNAIGWVLVSSKFVKLTKHLIKDDVQYLPVTILNEKTGEKITSYSVLNIISFTDALDLKNSNYNIWKTRGMEILSIIKPAFKRAKLKNKHIFRVKDANHALFVSEEIKKIVEENNLTGFGFLEVAVN